MKKILFLTILLIIPNTIYSNDVLNQIQQSHISSNLPNTFEEFQFILERDLKKYFEQKHKKNVDISYQLLRKGPTQSGVAYPKFYAWVEVAENNNKIESGAIRVASINKTRIEVTDFVSQNQIKENPTILETIFPRSLCKGIREKAKL